METENNIAVKQQVLIFVEAKREILRDLSDSMERAQRAQNKRLGRLRCICCGGPAHDTDMH